MRDFLSKRSGTYWIDPRKCVGCGICMRNCPVKAIDAAFIIDEALCISCGICKRFCWFGAVFQRKEESADAVRELEEDSFG